MLAVLSLTASTGLVAARVEFVEDAEMSVVGRRGVDGVDGVDDVLAAPRLGLEETVALGGVGDVQIGVHMGIGRCE